MMLYSNFVLRTSVIISIYFTNIQAGEVENVSFDCTEVYNCIPKNYKDTSKDDLIAYKSVLISFRQIMESRSYPLPPTAAVGIWSKIQLQYWRKTKPSETKIYKRKTFRKLQSDALALVRAYLNDFSEKVDYPIRAYYYRILHWIMFNMKHENEKNDKLEATIKKIFDRQQKQDEKAHNVVSIILREKRMERECKQIKKFDDLKNFGNQDDKITEYCLLLGQTKGKAAKKKASQMPYSRRVRLYEKLLSEIGSRNEDFRVLIGEFPFTILQYVYDAAHRKHNSTYQRPNGDLITLAPKNEDTLDLKYYRDIMIIYDNAIENTLLPHMKGEKTSDQVFQLENFPLDQQDFQTIRTDAFQSLAYFVATDQYDHEVFKLAKESAWTQNSALCYGRLLEWLDYYLLKKLPKQKIDEFYSRLYTLSETLRTGAPTDSNYEYSGVPAVSDPKYELKFTLNDEEYTKINTVEKLVEFCKTGKPHILSAEEHFRDRMSTVLTSMIGERTIR